MKKIITILAFFCVFSAFAGTNVKKTDIISSNKNDISPILNYNEDLLIFSSDRSGKSQIYGAYVKNGNVASTPFLIEKETFFNGLDVNSYESNCISLFANDAKMVFSAKKMKNGKPNAELFANKQLYEEWQKSEPLSDKINSNAIEEYPSITPDGKMMFFVSNREGSVNGSLDIWYAEYDRGFDKWSEPKNLKEVNTEFDETTPYIASDGNTLFFASKGYQNSKGGYDLFYIKKDPQTGKWGKVEYLPSDINSAKDDISPSFSRDGSKMFFASNRDGNYDIYNCEMQPLFSKPITLFIDAMDVNSGDYVLSNLYVKLGDDIVFSKKSDKAEFLVTDNIFKGKNYIDLAVHANNPLYNNQKQIIRLYNNQLQDKVSVTMMMLEEGAELNRSKVKIPYIDGKFDVVSNGKPVSSVTAYETLTKKVRPVLNYIFFDDNSSLIPRRYNQSKMLNGQKFDERLLSNMNTLDIYYEILNIIGSRMSKHSEETIKLYGYNSNSGKEKNDKKLSEARARSVANYLTDVWNVDPKRIEIEFGNLPEAASSSRTEEGKAENRRVEIIAGEKILSPILINWKMYKTIPETATIDVEPTIINSQADWKVNIYGNKKIIKTYYGQSKENESINWNISDDLSQLIPKPEIKVEQEEKPDEPEKKEEPEEKKEEGGFFSKALSKIKETANKVGDYINQNSFDEEVTIDTTSKKEKTNLTFELLIEDEENGKYLAKYKNIDFETKKPSELNIKPIRYDVFSFISFDFGKTSLTEEHQKTMTILNGLATPNSVAKIYAYSDNIGSDKVNFELSKKRANSVAESVNIENKEIIPKGESVLLFDNSLPEGRMYSRTVIIEMETPIIEENNEK